MTAEPATALGCRRSGSGPPAWTAALRPVGAHGGFVRLPPVGPPTVLLPGASPPAAAAAMVCFAADAVGGERLLADLMTAAVRRGALRLLPVSREWTDVLGYLRERLAPTFRQPEVQIAVRLGRSRPNRKPVVAVLTADGGRVLGYVKVGWDPLGRRLLRHERDTLEELADGPAPVHYRTPAVIEHHVEGDLELLAVSALPGPQARGSRRIRALPVDATLEVCRQTERGELGTSGYWRSVRARLAATAAAPDAAHRALEDAADEIERRSGGAQLGFGRCHGDWTSANMVEHGGVCHVWDWERSLRSAPLGIDAARFALREAERRAGRGQVRLREARRFLAPVAERAGLGPATIELLQLLDLLEMALRFREARALGVPTRDDVHWRRLQRELRGRPR